MRDVEPRFRLAALGLLTAVVVLLAAVGMLPRWPGIVHAVALPPLDLFHDLRVLVVHAGGWPVFVVGAAASFAVRVAVLAWCLGGWDRPRLGFAATYYAVAWPVAGLAAALVFGSPATLFYLLVWMGLAVAVLAVALLGSLPWSAEPRRWGPRGLVSGAGTAVRARLRLGTTLAYLGLLVLVGAVADLGGGVVAVALVPVSTALTLAAVHTYVEPATLRWPRRVLAAGTAAALLAVPVATMAGPAGPAGTEEVRGERAGDGREGSLALMSGIDSRSGSGAILEIDPVSLGYGCDQTYYLSYAGPGDGQPQRDSQCPARTGAPYQPEDTLRSGDEVVPWIREQVAGLEPPVVLIGHSQGAWLVWEAVMDGELPGVGVVVSLGPFPENPVTYPAGGGREPGQVGVAALWQLIQLPRPGGTTTFEPDVPLARDYLAHPTAISDVFATPLPNGVRGLGVTSAFDLPLMPGGWRLPEAADACPVPVMHPNLPYAAETLRVIDRFLDGEEPEGCALWRRAIGPAVRPFGAPSSAD